MQRALKDVCVAGALAFTGGHTGAAPTHQFNCTSNHTPLGLRTPTTQSCLPLPSTHLQTFKHAPSSSTFVWKIPCYPQGLLHSLLLHEVFLACPPPPVQFSVLPQALVLPADTDLIIAQYSQQLSQPENKFLKGSDGLTSLSIPRLSIVSGTQ